MPILRCSQGHQWETTSDATGIGLKCPVCGELELTRGLPHTTWAGPPTRSDSDVEIPPALRVRYDIYEEVGSGGMGIVYRARNRTDGTIVAIKVIRRDRLDSSEARDRFRREVLAARRLSHPNIVLLLDADEYADPPYLVMEFVNGDTLQKAVEANGPLPVADAIDVLRQTALGLQHAHEQGLVHRDIKPANLIAALFGTRRIVKILDMGVARLVHPRLDEPLATLTQPGAVIGTPDYIAPEQLEDSHNSDVRSDLYSLGCTAYFLLTGTVPFPGGTLFQKLSRHRSEVAPLVDQLRRDVPRSLAALVHRLMAKEANERFSTPMELVDALEALAAEGQVPGTFRAPALPLRSKWQAHQGAVGSVAFLPDGRVLSGGHDQSLRLWDTNGQEVYRIDQSRPVLSLAVLTGGNSALLATGVTLRMFDTTTGKELARWAGHTDAVRSLAVSPDGKLAASGSDDRMVRIWELQSGRTLDRLRHPSGVTSVAFSPDGTQLAAGGRDELLMVWDVAGARLIRSLPAPRRRVLSVAYRPGTRHLASGHYDTTVRLWDVDTGRERRRLQGHKQMVSVVACSPDGQTLASTGHDRTVRVWDLDSGMERFCGVQHGGAVDTLAFSLDGTALVSGGENGFLCVWEIPHQ